MLMEYYDAYYLIAVDIEGSEKAETVRVTVEEALNPNPPALRTRARSSAR